MKNHYFSFVLFVLLVSSCQVEQDDKESPVLTKEGSNFQFYTSREMYQKHLSERSSQTSESFEIIDAVLKENVQGNNHDYLTITVQNNQSCSGDFELIWDGIVQFSYPPKTNILVRFAGNCGEETNFSKQTVIEVDLDEFTGNSQLVSEAEFLLINGSKRNSDSDVSANVSN